MDNQFSIRVKIENNEIELRGNKKEVMATLDELPSIVSKISKSLKVLPKKGVKKRISVDSIEEEKISSPEGIPAISKPSGPSDAIRKLLSTGWGRTPRVWQEIDEALKTNAVYYSKGSITGTLTNLTKKNELRRIKTERGYAYTVA